MEEFGSLLWILIIAGAMIFNVTSQSRKAREKRKGQVPNHDEAWPTTVPAEPAEQARTGQQPGRTVYRPVTPAFPEEGQSLEEISEREYSPEFSVQKPADTGRIRHQTANRLATVPGKDEIFSEQSSNDIPEETAAGIAEEFDLRKAVIYAEILKPRFEEQA